ncbi:CRISPR-associated helicase Cas3' [Actinomycetaceae bacterium L2_0104]
MAAHAVADDSSGLNVLSPRALSVWAKSNDWSHEDMQWLPLAVHMNDAGSIASILYTTWFCESQLAVLRDCLRPAFPDSEDDDLDDVAASLATFITAVHDIGKATPAFSSKVESLDAVMAANGLRHGYIDQIDRRQLPHGLAGEFALSDWLENLGWDGPPRSASRASRDALGSVVGGHHGVPASVSEVIQGQDSAVRSLMGGSAWSGARNELLNFFAKRTGFSDIEGEVKNVQWTKSALVLLEGLIITSDWIASNEDFFPLFPASGSPIDHFLSESSLDERVRDAWIRLALPAQWRPEDTGADADSLLVSRFNLPAGSKARPSQIAAVEAARSMDLPGLLIIEDSMGAGKTEAALLAAEILAARAGCAGVLFALPTQATTDAIMQRVVKWIDNLASSGAPTPQNIRLLHGRAALNPLSRNLARVGYQRQDAVRAPAVSWEEDLVKGYRSPNFPDDATDVTRDASGGTGRHGARFSHPWSSGKKALLSDVVAGTIDQLLLTALKSPHLALRHLGLSRKVVIIDEIHSYDAYMNEYLKQALTWLAAYGVPVIALSATLTSEIKQELHNAYEKGCSGRKIQAETADQPLYPAITYPESGQLRTNAVAASGPAVSVAVHPLAETEISSRLNDLLSDGGCALVVRSTVKSAQETYEELRESFGDDVRLMHARFTSYDRLENDKWLLQNFGPPRSARNRPERAIVVATQVVEQSLDIDFDVLISDLAPVDLLFQRMGRVHRHKRAVRPRKMGTPRCFILDLPELSSSDPKVAGPTKAVYGAYLPLRSAAVLHRRIENVGSVSIPDDLPVLIEQVYGSNAVVPDSWSKAHSAAHKKFDADRKNSRKNAHKFLLKAPGRTSQGLLGWLDMNMNMIGDDGRATVREGMDSIEVILVDEDIVGGSEYWKVLPWIRPCGGQDLPMNDLPGKEQARALALSMVRLPAWMSRGDLFDKVLSQLDRTFIQEWQRNPLLNGQLILPLRENVSELAGTMFTYSTTTGLMEITNG